MQRNPTTSASVKQECCSFPTCVEANIYKIPPGADRACAAGVGYNSTIHRKAVGQGASVSPAPCFWAVGLVT